MNYTRTVNLLPGFRTSDFVLLACFHCWWREVDDSGHPALRPPGQPAAVQNRSRRFCRTTSAALTTSTNFFAAFHFGGGRWIRTTEGVSQQIYSLPPLAAWVSLQISLIQICNYMRRQRQKADVSGHSTTAPALFYLRLPYLACTLHFGSRRFRVAFWIVPYDHRRHEPADLQPARRPFGHTSDKRAVNCGPEPPRSQRDAWSLPAGMAGASQQARFASICLDCAFMSSA